jgi:threonine aldolase
MKRCCRARGIQLHRDGARIFEASARYAEAEGLSIRQLADPFDSMFVSFYKGLGGMSGAMLLGTSDFAVRPRRGSGGSEGTCTRSSRTPCRGP